MMGKVRAWEAQILRFTFRARMFLDECWVNYMIRTAKSLCIKLKRMGLPLLTENDGQNLDDFELGYQGRRPNHEGFALDFWDGGLRRGGGAEICGRW